MAKAKKAKRKKSPKRKKAKAKKPRKRKHPKWSASQKARHRAAVRASINKINRENS